MTYASPDSVPSGASPRCHDVDFNIGGFQSRAGTRSVYNYADSGITDVGTVVTTDNWTTPYGILDNSGAYLPDPNIDNRITTSGFGFNLTGTITKIVIHVTTDSIAPALLGMEISINGVAYGTQGYNLGSGRAALEFTNPGFSTGVTAAMVNSPGFGVRFFCPNGFPGSNVSLRDLSLTVYFSESAANFQYLKSFISSNGTTKTLAMDSSGNFWVEDVTNNPGFLSPLLAGLPSNSYAKSVTAYDREYICFSDLHAGDDLPLQYTGEWTDRVTQVGPGAPPQVTPQQASGTSYAISSITQPGGQSRTSSYFLQSAGPGSTTAGNVATVYYSDSTVSGPDTDLVTAFNSGNPVYLYTSFTGTPVTQGPYVVLVTSVGLSSPPGQPRAFYYFTYNLPTVANVLYSGSGNPGYTANYQRTLAIMDMAVPVPGLAVGNRATVTGNSVSNYNNTWLISQALNSGSFAVTQTTIVGGTATYSYTTSSGQNPSAGQPVTITGTTNANGALNLSNATIATASGGSSGTFTIAVSLPDASPAAESGQGTTAGTTFAFDPGATLVGTSTNPIYGTGTGGSIVYAGTAQYISAGTRQAVVFFITRNESETFPSIPITFTVPTNTSTLIVTQIPIGPPNVVARGIAITNPGQNGVPGGDFYTIDDPVTYTVSGVTYTSDSFIIHDNTSTSVSLTFRDTDLLAARRIDVQGEDLFNQIEIGNPAWVVSYASRLFFGLTQAKLTNFVNLSFDGGYLPSTNPQPLGWAKLGGNGLLITSAKFGNSYYIKNDTGATATLGGIRQTAYRDYYGAPIIRPNVEYSARVSARIPSGNYSGTLYVSLLFNNGNIAGSLAIPFSDLATIFKIVSGPLFSGFDTIPPDLTLDVYTTLDNGADVEIDFIEFFPTRQPINETLLLVSYAGDPEGVDGVTGRLNTNNENTQPCYGAVVMYDLLYLLKDRSMYYTQDSSGDEPEGWGVHEVSNKAGACGVNAYDSGEEWILMANRNGVYLFTGGEPRKISQEIQQVWDAINWSAGQSIWVRNDVQARKMYLGVPMPTPNFWLPDAPTNAAPSFPNVILMCSYEGQATGGEVAGADPIFATQFGNLDSTDMRRKWAIWQIPSPYADFIAQQNSENFPLRIGNGLNNSKIYTLDATNDDAKEIPWRYGTYGFGSDTDRGKFPGLGAGRVRWNYMWAQMTGVGTTIMKWISNKIDGNVSMSLNVPVDSGQDMRERPLNIPGNRVYVEFSSGGVDSTVDVSQLIMSGAKDVFNSLRGVE